MNQDHHVEVHRMLQAPVKAMDPHGVAVVSVGTVAFAVASGVCWWQLPFLESRDDGWWLTSSLLGLGIGVLALALLLLRRRRHVRRG